MYPWLVTQLPPDPVYREMLIRGPSLPSCLLYHQSQEVLGQNAREKGETNPLTEQPWNRSMLF
jgi:hypothetical protein